MKKLVLLAALVLSTSVYASEGEGGQSEGSSSGGSTSSGSTATSSSTSSATSSSSAVGVGVGVGVGVSVVKNNNQSTAAGGAASSQSSTVNNINTGAAESVPNVYAPNLSTTLTETCMGSTSAGAASFGFGASFGSTWSDEDCVRRLDARQMAALGEIAIAKEMMCASDTVREAAKKAGRPCKGDE